MKRLKILLMTLFLLGYLIWLKPEAQVGIFKNTQFIKVSTGIRSKTERNLATIQLKYKGHLIRLPYSSIAYYEVI